MKRLLFILFTVILNQSAIADSGFKTPPKQLADLVDAPRQPSVRISADKQWVAILARSGAKSIEELAQAEEKLAGLRINANISHQVDLVAIPALSLNKLMEVNKLQLRTCLLERL